MNLKLKNRSECKYDADSSLAWIRAREESARPETFKFGKAEENIM